MTVMQLQAYLTSEKLTYTTFAERIGSKHARTVERYAKGHQIPDRVMMARVVKATGGKVTPNDFFGVTPANAEAA